MRFGFVKFLLVALLLAILGVGAFLAFTDVPVESREIIVNVPVAAQ